MAGALEVPLYRLFYEGEESGALQNSGSDATRRVPREAPPVKIRIFSGG